MVRQQHVGDGFARAFGALRPRAPEALKHADPALKSALRQLINFACHGFAQSAMDSIRAVIDKFGRFELELNAAVGPVGSSGVSRRAVVKAAAWSVPVVAVAVAVPLAAASTTSVVVTVPGVGATNTITNWEGNHEQGSFDGPDDAPYLFDVVVTDGAGNPIVGATVTVTASGISDGNDILAVQAYPAPDGIDPENDSHPTETLATNGSGSAKFAVNTANINSGWFPATAVLTVNVTYNGATTTYTYTVRITSNA